MKKYSIILILSLVLLSCNINESKAIDFSNKDKAFFGDIGIGEPGFSLGVGYRYWFFGVQISYAGLFNSIPPYAYTAPADAKINPYSPLPMGFREDRYTASLLTIDLNGYFEAFLPFIVVGSIGYYTQADTVTAFQTATNNRYFYKYESSSGLCFGIGAEYQINDLISAGLLYHTKRGVLGRFTYFLND